MEEEHDMTSLRARRKKTSIGAISCCFNGTATKHHRRASFDATSSSSSSSPRSMMLSPSSWFKSKANDLPEIKGKCRSFISRMGRHRRHSSADFSYDPLSYALNFDQDEPSPRDDFGPTFTERLPLSPPRTSHDYPAVPRSPKDCATPKLLTAGSDHLRRGFQVLADTVKPEMRKNGGLSSPRAAAVAEVKRSLDADRVRSPVGIKSSNREILVRLG